MVKILVSGDYMDFEAPIYMTEERLEKFISFMTNMFGKIKKIEVEEVTKEKGETSSKKRIWKINDYVTLLSTMDNDLIAEKLKRSPISVQMMRGWFVSSFMSWAKKKGYLIDLNKGIE